MTVSDEIDVNPPYYFPDYEITEFRSPRRDLVKLPPWYREASGPDFSRIPVPSDGANLNEIHETQPIGQRTIIVGRVVDRAGQAMPHALIEIWQANGAGRYADSADPAFFPLDPNFTGHGVCLTDEQGKFEFITVRPAAYPGKRGGLYRPSHIHVSVFGDDLSSRLITQCYFPDDPLMSRDPIVKAIGQAGLDRLTAQFIGEMSEPSGEDSALAFNYDIVLRGRSRVGSGDAPPESPGVASASQTIGPLYGFALMFPDSENAVAPSDPAAVHIQGVLYDGNGDPVSLPDGMIEIWEGEQFARTRTDADGRYHAYLRRPVAGPEAGGRKQAPHFEVSVFARGLLKQAQTRLYLPDEELNASDPVLDAVSPELRPRLVADGVGANLTFDIHLQGTNESVFFDF